MGGGQQPWEAGGCRADRALVQQGMTEDRHGDAGAYFGKRANRICPALSEGREEPRVLPRSLTEDLRQKCFQRGCAWA